jgi:hypothetical protein
MASDELILILRILAAGELRDAARSLIRAQNYLDSADLTGTDWLSDWAVIAHDLAHGLSPITDHQEQQ